MAKRLVLHRFSKLNSQISLDIDENTWKEITPDSSEKVSGVFEILGGETIMLYQYDGGLTLQVGYNRFKFTSLVVKTKLKDNCRLTKIEMDNDLVCDFKNTRFSIPDNDLTPFVDEEDFDFGLFLRNLSMDERRQSGFFSS